MLQHWRGEMPNARVVPFQVPAPSLSNAALATLFRRIGASISLEDNAEVFSGESDHLYKVLTGAVRICRHVSDGRRIVAFYLQGEVFGLDADDHRPFSVEAVGKTTILAVKRSIFLAEAAMNSAAVAQLWTQTLGHFRCADAARLVGRGTPQERIRAFLLDIAERSARVGDLEIRLPHADIADYLDTTVLMVSQVIAQLRRDVSIDSMASECSGRVADEHRIAA